MRSSNTGVGLLVLSGLLAALGGVQLVALAKAAEPMLAAFSVFVALVPAGYFLGLFAARPKAVSFAAAEEIETQVPEGQSVVVPFRRRSQ